LQSQVSFAVSSVSMAYAHNATAKAADKAAELQQQHTATQHMELMLVQQQLVKQRLAKQP
jgi:hypothetical protein